MAQIGLLLLLLLTAVALGWVARHFKFPYPIALVAGGVAAGALARACRAHAVTGTGQRGPARRGGRMITSRSHP